ncbi:VOC family protein [Niveibacterium sp. 24ML]|uniref:VOC family protein n=1 Tax=Niveibacterium sp. 24ML TaxID=2985512 RepID=UPI00226FC97B|nr:VOC family protein [Niveibacterium sp. 24ML]MCX9157348.1 VOC family protein [Niveibacterium sp. 24ML]
MDTALREQQRAVWFEIPVVDLDRAAAFYEQLFDESLRREEMGPEGTIAVFPYDGTGVSGCLMRAPDARPAASGTLVYLNADSGLDTLLARVEAAGGKVALPPVALPEGMGRFAHIIDTEGNLVGLHEA